MKFLKIWGCFMSIGLFLFSCSKSSDTPWGTQITTPQETVNLIDISKDFYDSSISNEAFSAKYPWFQGSVHDSIFWQRRKDENDIKVYRDTREILKKINLSQELSDIFRRIKMYFPEYQSPKVYIYSSGTKMYLDPIIYDPESSFLFIDLSCFLGEKHASYEGIENYLKKSMTPDFLLSKTAEAIAKTMVPFDRNEQKFLELMLYEGKVKILQEALIPHTSEEIRLNLTQEQYKWTAENEANIWNYFIENNILYDESPKLTERFLAPAPFSKFYTEIDKEASPQVGIFIGKKICDSYFKKHENEKLSVFLSKNAHGIFKEAGYKPQ